MARQADRPGFLSSLPLPSRTEGIVIAVVMLLTAIAVGVAARVASNRTTPVFEAPADAGASAERSPAPVDALVIAFYGDRYVVGTQQGGVGPAGWPAILTERLGAQATDPHALIDAGYVATSSFGDITFEALAAQQPEPDADVTVVLGSRNDVEASPQDITAAATRTFDVIRADAPDTRLLVIGPVWTGPTVPPELPPVRDAVREAAAAAGALFVDPLGERWFLDDTGRIAPDRISPTDAGHAYLADQIEPFVRALLAREPGPASAAATTPAS